MITGLLELLISGGVRAAIVLGVGLAAYALLARTSAATRRFVLALTLGAALVVPIAAAVGPRWRVETPAALAVFAHESAAETAPTVAAPGASSDRAPAAPAAAIASPPAGGLAATDILVLAWLVLACALLARAVASQLGARTLVGRAKPVAAAPWAHARHSADVRVSAELDSPIVTGLLRPTIVIPHAALAWPLERCRLVLVHELAHVRRRDVLVQALADVACALHWWNPLAWICARRFRVACELAADDAVLAAGVRPSHYAEELVAVATSVGAPRAALAMAERSSLETRVTSILAARLARAPLAARGTLAVLAVASALAAAAACTSPQELAPDRVTEPASAPQPGTATDPAIQRAADDELAAISTEWSPELATIVVLDPATGEILANAGRSAGKPADVSAVAITPGSTLKPITIAAALELHAITVGQTFDCGPAPRMYGDKALRDASPNQTLDVAHILAVSSNIGTSRIFDALGGDHFVAWLRRFHFGAGAIPAHVETGSFEGGEAANGEALTATPLEMIAAYGAIAGDGVYHAPTRDRGGSPAERILSADTARAVVALLETAVVDDAATGKAARVDGIHVAGKTGTAEWTAADGKPRTYASFIGIADLPARRVVVLVGVQTPREDVSGGKVAAPAFARLVNRIR